MRARPAAGMCRREVDPERLRARGLDAQQGPALLRLMFVALYNRVLYLSQPISARL